MKLSFITLNKLFPTDNPHEFHIPEHFRPHISSINFMDEYLVLDECDHEFELLVEEMNSNPDVFDVRFEDIDSDKLY